MPVPDRDRARRELRAEVKSAEGHALLRRPRNANRTSLPIAEVFPNSVTDVAVLIETAHQSPRALTLAPLFWPARVAMAEIDRPGASRAAL